LDSHNPTTDHSDVLAKPGLPPALSLLRQKLSQKAKHEPRFRFYALYDRIFRYDTLVTAWELVYANRGAPGIDRVGFSMIIDSQGGIAGFLKSIQEDLRLKRYQPHPVKRVYISKANGKLRPLGIPTIRDRVVQMAVLLILEPIFEADFEDCSYGFRPGRSAHQALEAIEDHLNHGFRAVYDADLQGYFDTIPHDKLMACVRMRIADRSVLQLIGMWLKATVVEEDEDGRSKGHRPKQGTPQGGVLSPLLANVYLHWFDKTFHRKKGPANFAKAKLVRYADDFVVLAKYQGKRLIEWVEGQLEGWLGLKINREKTRVVNLEEEGSRLDFLGYSFSYEADRHGRGHRYLRLEMAEKSLKREREKLKQMTRASMCFKPIGVLVAEVNRQLEGWKEYFNRGYPQRGLRKIWWYVKERMRRHLWRRSQRGYRKAKGISWDEELRRLGLRPICATVNSMRMPAAR